MKTLGQVVSYRLQGQAPDAWKPLDDILSAADPMNPTWKNPVTSRVAALQFNLTEAESLQLQFPTHGRFLKIDHTKNNGVAYDDQQKVTAGATPGTVDAIAGPELVNVIVSQAEDRASGQPCYSEASYANVQLSPREQQDILSRKSMFGSSDSMTAAWPYHPPHAPGTSYTSTKTCPWEGGYEAGVSRRLHVDFVFELKGNLLQEGALLVYDPVWVSNADAVASPDDSIPLEVIIGSVVGGLAFLGVVAFLVRSHRQKQQALKGAAEEQAQTVGKAQDAAAVLTQSNANNDGGFLSEAKEVVPSGRSSSRGARSVYGTGARSSSSRSPGGGAV